MATANLKDKTTAELVEMYNKAARQIGVAAVTRFADRKTAEKRVKRISEEVAARAGRTEAEPRAVRASAAKSAPRRSAAKSAKARTPGAPRAYKDKVRAPGRIAYEPQAGTIQAEAVKKLRANSKAGVEVTAMCDFLNERRRGSKPITASTVWTELTYILCDKRGFGLEAKDGRLYLKEPSDVRAVAAR